MLNAQTTNTPHFTPSRLLRIRDRINAVWVEDVPDDAVEYLVRAEKAIEKALLAAEPQTIDDLLAKVSFAHQIATNPDDCMGIEGAMADRVIADVERFLNRAAETSAEREAA